MGLYSRASGKTKLVDSPMKDLQTLIYEATDPNAFLAQRHKAFGELVRRYQDMVYGICYRMTSDPVDAEDLAHDAFIEAFLKIGQLVAPEKFGDV